MGGVLSFALLYILPLKLLYIKFYLYILHVACTFNTIKWFKSLELCDRVENLDDTKAGGSVSGRD